MATETDNSVLQQVLANMPVGALVLDGSGRISWLNERLAACFGVATDALLGLSQDDDMPQHFQQLFYQPSLIIVPAGEQVEERWLSCHYAEDVVPDSSAARINFYIDVSEMTTIRKGEEGLSGAIQQLTVTDALTGLPNKQALLYALDPMIFRSRRYDSPLSVVLVRIDGVDELGDGQEAGAAEKLILAVSRLLRDQMRWADMIGRYERNVFLCVLQETDNEAANKLVKKIQSKVKALTTENLPGAGSDALDVCVGIAEWCKGDDGKSLIERASNACSVI